MDTRLYQKLSEAYASVYAPQEVEEGVRDLDPEKGTAERKAKLEKKRGMKMDDHPQYKKAYENVEELYKGKHGQTDKQYALTPVPKVVRWSLATPR